MFGKKSESNKQVLNEIQRDFDLTTAECQVISKELLQVIKMIRQALKDDFLHDNHYGILEQVHAVRNFSHNIGKPDLYNLTTALEEKLHENVDENIAILLAELDKQLLKLKL